MTIVYLLRYYPTLTETFVYQEIQSLVDNGFHIKIIRMGSRADGLLADMLPNVTVTTVPRAYRFRMYADTSPGIAFLTQHQRLKDIARYRWLREHIKKDPPSLIHAHFAGEAAEWAHALSLDLGIPNAVTVHAVDMFRPRPSFPVLLNATHVRTISHYALGVLQEANPAAQLECIPCAVHIPNDTHPIPMDHLRAVFIGRDVPKKGLSILLEAWKHIPSPHRLTVVSQTTQKMPQGAKELGFLPQSQIPLQIQSHNLLILPARMADNGDMDGIPMVCMEALAHRRPVLSTALSGIPELIDEEVGWLIEKSTVGSLTQALKLIISNLAKLKTKGDCGPQRLETGGYTYNQQSRALVKWFDKVTVSCQFRP